MTYNEIRAVALIGYAALFCCIGLMLLWRATQSSKNRSDRIWLGVFLVFAAAKNLDTALVRIRYDPEHRGSHIADFDSTFVLVVGLLIGIVALTRLVFMDERCWDGETERRSGVERRKDWCR